MHPFLHARETKGRLAQERSKLISGNGVYGVGAMTDRDTADIHRRTPSRYTSRIEMAMHQAEGRAAASAAALRRHLPQLRRVAFTPQSADGEYISDFHAKILPKLREHDRLSDAPRDGDRAQLQLLEARRLS